MRNHRQCIDRMCKRFLCFVFCTGATRNCKQYILSRKSSHIFIKHVCDVHHSMPNFHEPISTILYVTKSQQLVVKTQVKLYQFMYCETFDFFFLHRSNKTKTKITKQIKHMKSFFWILLLCFVGLYYFCRANSYCLGTKDTQSTKPKQCLKQQKTHTHTHSNTHICIYTHAMFTLCLECQFYENLCLNY